MNKIITCKQCKHPSLIRDDAVPNAKCEKCGTRFPHSEKLTAPQFNVSGEFQSQVSPPAAEDEEVLDSAYKLEKEIDESPQFEPVPYLPESLAPNTTDCKVSKRRCDKQALELDELSSGMRGAAIPIGEAIKRAAAICGVPAPPSVIFIQCVSYAVVGCLVVSIWHNIALSIWLIGLHIVVVVGLGIGLFTGYRWAFEGLHGREVKSVNTYRPGGHLQVTETTYGGFALSMFRIDRFKNGCQLVSLCRIPFVSLLMMLPVHIAILQHMS